VAKLVRHNLYLDRSLSDALGLLATRPGASQSQILRDALRSYVETRGGAQIDAMLRLRLDGLSREQAAVRRDIEVLLESLSLFVRYQLTVTAPLPEADLAGRAVGRDRFESFVAQVGRQIAAGRRTLGVRDEGGGQ
jgi:hypothetical protein